MLPNLKRSDALSAVRDWFAGGEFRREVALFAAEGMGIVSMHTEGRIGHVEFDFPRIWAAMKAAPRMPRKVWMLHTHPPGCAIKSDTDTISVKGWATALGMPVEMGIVAGMSVRRYVALKGNVVHDFGTPEILPSESLVAAVMCGLSWSPDEPSQSDMDVVTRQLNEVLPMLVWDCEHRAGIGIEDFKDMAKFISGTESASQTASSDLFDADEECDHDEVPQPGGGVKCSKCGGWFCF